jgi:hypothetical protein
VARNSSILKASLSCTSISACECGYKKACDSGRSKDVTVSLFVLFQESPQATDGVGQSVFAWQENNP